MNKPDTFDFDCPICTEATPLWWFPCPRCGGHYRCGSCCNDFIFQDGEFYLLEANDTLRKVEGGDMGVVVSIRNIALDRSRLEVYRSVNACLEKIASEAADYRCEQIDKLFRVEKYAVASLQLLFA